MAKQFSYSKAEKFKSKKELDILFSSKKSILIFPLKVFYSFNDIVDETQIKFGVGVSKKKINSSPKRNRVKRLLRESYRLNKHILLNQIAAKQINFFALYIHNELPINKMEIEPKLIKVMEKLITIYKNEMDK